MSKLNSTAQRVVGRRPNAQNKNMDSRTAILKAARQVFARRGVDGTSVRDVAEIAKVNSAMIYYHFKDKNGLYRAVLQYSFEVLDAIWEDPIFQQGVSTRQKLEKYIEEFIRFQHANEDLRRIMTMEHAVSCSDNCKWLADNFFQHHYQKMVAILKEGMRRGELRKADPKMVIASLLGIIIHNFISQPVTEHVSGEKIDLTAKKFGKFVAEIFFDGLAEKKRLPRKQ